MGTRSLTVIEKDGEEICTIYRQYDGYESAHGKDLKSFLKNKSILNGLPIGKEISGFNGMEDLAACLIWKLKDKLGEGDNKNGSIYLLSPKERGWGEQYIYIISEVSGKIFIKTETYFGDINNYEPCKTQE